MREMHANDVSVLVRTVLVKPKPVARHLDQTANQESPFWPGSVSQGSFRRGGWSGGHSLTLLLPAHGDAVAQRKQNWVELLRGVDEPVKFLYALRVKVIRRDRPCRFSRPQRIVRDEQPAAAQLGQCHAQRSRVLALVDVVEDQVKRARRFFQQFKRVADAHVDAFSDACPAEIILRAPRFFSVAIRISHFSLW